MSRRQDAATAAAGTTGVVGGALLRERAMHRAYGKAKRPAMLGEKIFLKSPIGRKTYVGGALLAGASVTPAIAGTRGLLRQDRRFAKADSLVAEGARGYAATLNEKRRRAAAAPPSLNAANYAASTGAVAGGAGLAHLAMRNKVIPRHARAAAAALGGVALGGATLGAQSKVINRASHGEYEVTSTGVRRAKKKAIPASRRADVVEGRPGRTTMHPEAVRQRMGVGKAESYYGQNLTPRQKQARVLAAGGPPVIGDFTSAAAAARMAPPGLRARTAAYQYGGSSGGQVAGTLAGGFGAAALARKVPGVGAKAQQAQGHIDDAKAKVGARVPQRVKDAAGSSAGLKAKATQRATSSGTGARLMTTGRKLAKPIFGHGPAVAAAGVLGATVGGSVGQLAGGTAGYSRALKLEQARNAKAHSPGRRGTRLAKADTGMSQAEHGRQAKRKKRQAHIAMFTGTTGLGALAATGLGAKGVPAPKRVKAFARAAQTPLLTAGAGVGGYGSFNFARTQLREADAERRLSKPVTKAYLSPRTGTLVRRAPAMRRGYLRQTRGTMGIRTATVRGGLG